METTRIEFRLGGEPVVQSYRAEYTVLRVGGDGTLTVRAEITERSLKVGKEPEIRNESPLVQTARVDTRGNVVAELDEDGDVVTNPEPIADTEAEPFASDHLGLAYGYVPRGPVGAGAEWTPPMDERLNLYPLKFRLVGEAKGELTVTGAGDGREGSEVACTVVLDAATFRRKRTSVRITKVPMADEKGDGVMEGRIEIEVVALASK